MPKRKKTRTNYSSSKKKRANTINKSRHRYWGTNYDEDTKQYDELLNKVVDHLRSIQNIRRCEDELGTLDESSANILDYYKNEPIPEPFVKGGKKH